MRTKLPFTRCPSRRAGLGWALAIGLGLAVGATQAADAVSTNGYWLADLSRPATAEAGDELTARFSVVPGGLQQLDGVPFSIRSPLALSGTDLASEGQFLATEYQAGASARAAHRLHLLHTSLGDAKDGTPLFEVVLDYADGTHESMRLGYGVHAREWVRNRSERRSRLANPQSTLAWSRGGDDGNSPQLRLFHTALDNPRPAEPIAGIRFVSLFNRAAPVVMALTLEEAARENPAPRLPATSRAARDLRDNPASAYRGELAVRVTDGDGQAPLTNATALLAVTDDTKTFFFGEVPADATGVCRVPYPVQHTLAITLLVRAPDRMPMVFSESLTNRARFSKEFSAALKPGVKIGGVVKGPDGKPIAGAEVLIHQVEKLSTREYRRTDFASVRTGADGRWSSACMPAGFAQFSFQVSHPEFRPALYTMPGQGGTAALVPAAPMRTTISAPLAPPPELNNEIRLTEELSVRSTGRGPQAPPVRQRIITTRSTGPLEVTSNALASATAEFTLQPAIRIEGVLLGHDAKPIPGAGVVFQRNSPAFERRRLQTDAEGRFRFLTPEPGDGALVVVREGHTPKQQYFNIEPAMPPLEIRLAPARVFRGRIVDRQQRPVPGARVRLDDWQGFGDLLAFQAFTDEEGRFAWTGAPPDQVTFQLSKTNCYTTRHSASAGVNELTMFLNRMPGISGRVIDADTRQPIDTFTLVRGRKYSANEAQVHWERYETPRGRAGEYFIRLEEHYFQPEARLMVEAPGYVPAVSPGFTSSGTHIHDFALKKGQGLRGEVRQAGGEPAVGATVVLVCRGDNGYMDSPGQLRNGGNYGDFARTDARGQFEFSPKLEVEGILAVHDTGFVEARLPQIPTNLSLALQLWGQIQGVMRVGDKADPERWVVMQNQYDDDPSGRSALLGIYLKADPDSEGRFVINKVPPGRRRIDVEYRLRDRNYGDTPFSHGRVLQVKPGETNDVTLGGTGRQVVGQMKVIGGDVTDVDWRRDTHRLVSASRAAGQPGLGAVASLVGTIFGANPSRAAAEENHSYVVLFETNGVFRVDHVPPGKYRLQINVTDPEEEYYNRRPMGNAQKEVEVPAAAGAKVNEPLDIGAIELPITPKLRIGRAAPPFEAKAFDGKSIKLSDYKGKHVLLFFWASYAGLGTYDLNVLRELQNSYSAQGKLVVLGLNVDASLEAASNFARTQNMTWTQLHLGEWGQSKVPASYGVDSFPTGLLLDGEGRLVARQLRGSGMRNAVRNALD